MTVSARNAASPRGSKGTPLSLLLGLWAALSGPETMAQDGTAREDMVARAHRYLLTIQKDGTVGDARHHFVTPIAALANLSSGHLPAHPQHGPAITAGRDWLLGGWAGLSRRSPQGEAEW